jgi:tetratricopeptide (TPR) repeat protein
MIESLFEMGDSSMAVALTRQNLQLLLNGKSSGGVFKKNIEYCYQQSDAAGLVEFANYYKKFDKDESYANLLIGRLFVKQGKYNQAILYYNALLSSKSHVDEANYFLARYSLYVLKNRQMAMQYYGRLIPFGSNAGKYHLRALIDASIMYNDMKNSEKARACLDEAIKISSQGVTALQAGNLYEAYGYK